jgi:glycosyltransferase involved in cell wall biosynthesis
MNIWILNHFANHPNLPGGTRHFDLAYELTKRGYKVTIFASVFKHHGGLKVELDDSEVFRIQMIEGIRFIWIRTMRYDRNDWRRIMSMVGFMLQSLRVGYRFKHIVPNEPRPDVVIGSSLHLLAVLAAYFLAEKYDAKFIMEVRDLWPQTLVEMGALGDRNPIVLVLRSLECFLYRRAERIISLLPHAGEYIIAHGGIPEKIVWIPNGVDMSRFLIPISNKTKRKGFTVMYLGAHGRANALDVIIKAARIVQEKGISDIRFVMIGRGPDKSRLIDMSNRLNLQNVSFWNPIQKSQVPQFLNKADAFIFNLEQISVFKYGISSNKLFDYMAAAKPVVFSVDSSNNPVQETNCGKTVPPCDPVALSQAILQIYNMPEKERMEMGFRGRRYVEQHHDWTILAKRFEKMLMELNV